MEINNDINEIVYMKRDIKSHRIYEKHPNLMFGIIILVWGLLFFFGCVLGVLDGFSDYNCYTHNQRVTQKFRNVYDFSFIRR